MTYYSDLVIVVFLAKLSLTLTNEGSHYDVNMNISYFH
jgi:hypothetical protein